MFYLKQHIYEADVTKQILNCNVLWLLNAFSMYRHLDIFSRPPTWPVPDIDDIHKTLSCLIEFWHTLIVDKKHMRSFAISASLESVQEIQDSVSLNTPLYQYRLQPDTLQVRDSLLLIAFMGAGGITVYG